MTERFVLEGLSHIVTLVKKNRNSTAWQPLSRWPRVTTAAYLPDMALSTGSPWQLYPGTSWLPVTPGGIVHRLEPCHCELGEDSSPKGLSERPRIGLELQGPILQSSLPYLPPSWPV